MKSIIQQETTGCAIACAAAISGLSYIEAKTVANGLGIVADDTTLWSETGYIRKLFGTLDIQLGSKEVPFESWGLLPNCALLSIKWHLEKDKPYWHWVLFIREDEQAYILDSKKSLKSNVRTDFGRIKPKWYIEVKR